MRPEPRLRQVGVAVVGQLHRRLHAVDHRGACNANPTQTTGNLCNWDRAIEDQRVMNCAHLPRRAASSRRSSSIRVAPPAPGRSLDAVRRPLNHNTRLFSIAEISNGSGRSSHPTLVTSQTDNPWSIELYFLPSSQWNRTCCCEAGDKQELFPTLSQVYVRRITKPSPRLPAWHRRLLPRLLGPLF